MHLRQPTDGSLAVYALLSIWICVIISIVLPAQKTRETLLKTDNIAVLILDPGHGGLDGGAVSLTGTYESSINWAIACRCRSLAQFCGLRAVMTRGSFDIAYPLELKSISAKKKWDTRSRAEFINSMPGALLLSIHQNTFPSASPRGTQVLYAPDPSSREFGEVLRKAFAETLPSDPKRPAVPAGRDIYLMNHVRGPALLVECGFLSNPEEAVRLETEEYQKTLAMIMIHAIRQNWE